MEKRNRLLGQASLANGLEVHFHDLSKEIAADRWHVRLSIRVPIELRREYFGDGGQNPGAIDDFLLATGGKIDFTAERQLNFVDANKVEESLDLLKNEFMKTNCAYLASPEFAAKFVRKRYQEWLQQEELRRRYAEHLLSTEKVVQ